jgi:tetratricopeptide (TPR) repeat protein
LLSLFRTFDNYPLLLRALAGEVAAYRAAPGDFDRWRRDHAYFNPSALPLKNAKTHVLEFALRGLGQVQRRVLRTLSAFRMPATWDTLCALLVRRRWYERGSFANDRALDAVLTELEDRGLVGWDKRANRYDLHPIVRGVVWAALDPSAKQDIYGELHTYFDASPRPPEMEKVESLEDLTPAVELFDKLVGLGRYQDAVVIFRDHLAAATFYRLSANRLIVELLGRLFPDGVGGLPSVAVQAQGYTLSCLARAFNSSGEPGRAEPLHRRVLEIAERNKDARNLSVDFCNLADTLRPVGRLWEAEAAARRAILKEGHLRNAGIVLAARGEGSQSHSALRRALAMAVEQRDRHSEGLYSAYLCQRHLWLWQPGEALPLAQRAWELAYVDRVEVDFIRAAQMQGKASLGLGNLATAEERLQHALTRARTVSYVEQELPALTALAELHRQRKEYSAARERLDDVWAPAERGPYVLWHADALNVLAQLERDLGHGDAAVAAATQAYRLAWCDGPPYAYHYGLTNARKLLQELGAPEPQLPPFDAAKFPPMPDVELNPRDEFYVEPED